MCGSRPLAEAVTRSAGTGRVLPGSAARSAATRSRTADSNAGFVGPRFEPLDDAPLYGCGEVADGRLQKYFRLVNGCPSKLEPTARPLSSMTLPEASCAKNTRPMTVTTPG